MKQQRELRNKPPDTWSTTICQGSQEHSMGKGQSLQKTRKLHAEK